MRDVNFAIETMDGPFSGVLTVDVGTTLYIDVGRKRWRMFWSEMWGPSACDRHGDILATQPGPRHEFWRAATLWNRQGRRAEDGVAVWHEPAPEILQTVRRKGRHVEVRVIQEGEDPFYSRQVLLPAPEDATGNMRSAASHTSGTNPESHRGETE